MNKLARCFLTFSFLLVILLTSSRCVGISSIMRGAETATVEDGTDVAGVPTSSPTPSQTATKTPFPTASDTPTPTITPTPTLTLMPSPTATPTLPAASSAPNGSGVVTVIEYEDKILGLNQHGWAEMEFIDGKWVEFVREISLAGGNREVWENIPHHLLEDIDVNSIVRYRVEGTDFVSKRAGNTLIEYQGRELPHNEDGQLAWGYLYTERMMYTGPNTKVDRTDNGVPDQAYISGFVRGVFSGPNGWERLIVEIPSPKNPTLRQIFMFILPDQKNTHSNTYVVGEDGLVNVMDARSLHYYVMLEKLKAPEAAGVQIVISLPLNDPDERDQERNRRNAEIISAIQSGDYFDLDGVNINSGIEVGNGPWWIWISELIMQGAW